jgi:hypothetical protein
VYLKLTGSSQERRGYLILAVTKILINCSYKFSGIEKARLHGCAVQPKLAGQAKKEEEKLKLAVALYFPCSAKSVTKSSKGLLLKIAILHIITN